VVGVVLFLIYCQVALGHWNLYFETGRIGWRIRSDLLAPFLPGTYSLNGIGEHFRVMIQQRAVQTSDIWVLGKMLTLITLVPVLGGVALASVRVARSWPQVNRRSWLALQLHWAALLMLYLAISGTATRALISMGRYCYPVVVASVLGWWQLVELPPAGRPIASLGFWAAVGWAIGLGALMQVFLIRLFAVPQWVF
jgi:hypothetical protein